MTKPHLQIGYTYPVRNPEWCRENGLPTEETIDAENLAGKRWYLSTTGRRYYPDGRRVQNIPMMDLLPEKGYIKTVGLTAPES